MCFNAGGEGKFFTPFPVREPIFNPLSLPYTEMFLYLFCLPQKIIIFRPSLRSEPVHMYEKGNAVQYRKWVSDLFIRPPLSFTCSQVKRFVGSQAENQQWELEATADNHGLNTAVDGTKHTSGYAIEDPKLKRLLKNKCVYSWSKR